MFTKKIERWGDRHHPALLDVLRITLGVFLCCKGLLFMQNMTYLRSVLDTRVFLNVPSVVITIMVYYTVYIHMVCGALVALGLMTRLSSLLQLPVVLAAIFLVHIFRSPFNSDVWLSVFAGVLLAVFSVIGSGPISLDNYLSKISAK